MDIFKRKVVEKATGMYPNRAAKRLAKKSARAGIKRMAREEVEIHNSNIEKHIEDGVYYVKSEVSQRLGR